MSDENNGGGHMSGPFDGNEGQANHSADDFSDSQSASMSEEVFEMIQEGVAVVDPDLTIRNANPSFRKLLGIDMVQPKPSLAGHPLVEATVTVDGSTRTVAEALQDTLRTGVRLPAADVHCQLPGHDSSECFSVQAKRRQSPKEPQPQILLWVKRGEEGASNADTNATTDGHPNHQAPQTEVTGPKLVPTAGFSAHSETNPMEMDPSVASQQLQSLIDSLNLITNFDALCNKLLAMALDISQGISGSLMLTHENGRELQIVASRGLSSPIVHKTRQTIGEGIAGKVAETGEPLLLGGRVGDSRFRGTGGRDEVSSSVCVPIKADQQVLGVLNINSSPTAPPFDEGVRDKTAGFASQLGRILRHSRQFQAMKRRSEQLTIRAEIESVAFSKDGLDAKLEQVLKPVERLLDVDTCSIYLVDDEKQMLKLAACSGMQVSSKPNVSVPFGVGVPGWVAQHGTPVTLTGRFDDDRQEAPCISTIGVPISHRDDSLGVIVMEDTSGKEDVTALRDLGISIAGAVAHVIRDATAQGESKRKMTVLSALSEIGLAMTESPDSSSFAKLTAYCAVTLLECDIALVRLANHSVARPAMKTSDLDLEATHGISPPESNHPMTLLEEQLIDHVIVSAEPRRDIDLPEHEMRTMMENADVKTALCVPMMSGDSLIGTITAFCVDSKPADRDHEVEIGERLGDYAAAAARRFILLAS